MTLLRDQAIVIRSWKLGEADRIVSLFSREHGKLRAVAKGSRRLKSRVGARIEPLVVLNIQLWLGRDLHVISQVETIESNFELRRDLTVIQRAMSILELVDRLAHDDHEDPPLYDATIRAFRSLASSNSPLFVPAFYLRAMQLEGFQPSLDRCRDCGATEGITGFDVRSGDVICRDHPSGLDVSPGVLSAMRGVLGGRTSQVLAETSPQDAAKVETLVVGFCESMIERRLRAIRPMGGN